MTNRVWSSAGRKMARNATGKVESLVANKAKARIGISLKMSAMVGGVYLGGQLGCRWLAGAGNASKGNGSSGNQTNKMMSLVASAVVSMLVVGSIDCLL